MSVNVEAEILGGSVSVEGWVEPPEPRTWEYPGYPASCEDWSVVALDREALGAHVGHEFASDEEATAWVEANCDEEAREALEQEYGEEG